MADRAGDLAGDLQHAGPLARGAALLRLLATAGRRGAALSTLAQATGLAASTTHRLLGQLVAQRLAMQLDESRRYAIGPMAYELGLAAAQQFDIRGLCRPALEQLALEAGETAYLVLRSGDEAVCIDLAEGPSPVRVSTLQIGSRRPLGVGAGGLAVLAALPDDEAARILARVADRVALEWQFPAAALRRSVHDTRRRGQALIRNRITPGVTALGQAFHDSLGQVLGGVSVAGANARMTEPRLRALQGRVAQAARAIEQALKGHQWARLVAPG